MKVKITMSRSASSYNKSNAVSKISRDLGSKVSISGDVVTVEAGYDEKKVIEILGREKIDYSRSSH